MELARVFVEALAAAGGRPLAGDDAQIEDALAALVARGRAAYPELAVAPAQFVDHLGRCAARAGIRDLDALAALEIEDLHLAHACLQREPHAAAAFESRCAPRLRAALGATARSPELRAEVEQRVRELLLVGMPEDPPKLASYGGQGPLDHFVAVVAQRQVFRVLRSDETELRARERAALETALGAVQPEVAYAKQRYRRALEGALKQALAVLGDRDRLLLRLHLVGGASATEIGNMYGVNQSTASRWLARARDAVATELRRLVREQLRISVDELPSLARLVASQMDASISRILRE